MTRIFAFIATVLALAWGPAPFAALGLATIAASTALVVTDAHARTPVLPGWRHSCISQHCFWREEARRRARARTQYMRYR